MNKLLISTAAIAIAVAGCTKFPDADAKTAVLNIDSGVYFDLSKNNAGNIKLCGPSSTVAATSANATHQLSGTGTVTQIGTNLAIGAVMTNPSSGTGTLVGCVQQVTGATMQAKGNNLVFSGGVTFASSNNADEGITLQRLVNNVDLEGDGVANDQILYQIAITGNGSVNIQRGLCLNNAGGVGAGCTLAASNNVKKSFPHFTGNQVGNPLMTYATTSALGGITGGIAAGSHTFTVTLTGGTATVAGSVVVTIDSKTITSAENPALLIGETASNFSVAASLTTGGPAAPGGTAADTVRTGVCLASIVKTGAAVAADCTAALRTSLGAILGSWPTTSFTVTTFGKYGALAATPTTNSIQIPQFQALTISAQ